MSLCCFESRTACGDEGKKITITDMGGRTVEVPLNPDRIICLSSGTLRQICYLKKAEKVAGIEDFERSRTATRPYMLANPDLLALPSVGPGGPGSINKEPDLEKVLKLKPQVIFISYMEPARAEALQKKLGIPVVILTHGAFATFDEKVYDSIRLAGKILKAENRGDEIVTLIESFRKDLKTRTEGIEEGTKPTAYVGAVLYKGVQGIESTDATYAPMEWVGAKNLAKQGAQTGHLFVDKEAILRWDPEVIFLDAGAIIVVEQDMAKRPEFYKGLKAFRNGKVYLVYPFIAYVTNIGTALANSYSVGKILFPDRFDDVDIKKKADEIYRALLGKPVYEGMEKEFGPLGKTLRFHLQ
jgi:iron complex transport system substrate-binding protein